MVSAILLVTFVAPLLVSAAPSRPSATNECPIVCIDLLSDCGVRYGGCVPHCKGEPMPAFSEPPCPTATPTQIEKRQAPADATSSDKSCPTVCIDGISDCGERFGGCIPLCKGDPLPKWSTSACPTTTPTPKVEKRDLAPKPTSIEKNCPTVCIDGISDCGERFGGCVPHCPGEPWPTFSTSDCPTATSTKVEKRDVEPEPTSTCPIVCIDGISDCGERFGGCVPHCKGEPWPTFSTSACPTTATPTATPHSGVAKRSEGDKESCPEICIDAINDCGIRFGGCGPVCSLTLSTPPCPTATTATYLQPSNGNTLKVEAKPTPN